MNALPADRLTGAPLVLTLGAICVGNFMLILDTTIVAVALPSITGGLSASPVQGTWIYTIYAVCMAVMLPLSGWLTRRVGEVRVFLLSAIGFTLTSWLCGISPNFELLILFRALQGFAAGMMMPLSQTLLMRVLPDNTPVAMSLWSITAAVAPVLGPLLGGYITDRYGWEWIFYINIGPGIMILPVIWKWLMPLESERHKVPVDRVGLCTLVVGVICLQVFLDQGREHDWLSSGFIILMLLIAIVSAVVFFIWEPEEKHPIVDLSLFRIRSFTVGTLYLSVFFGVFTVNMMLPPTWFQSVLGYTATWAGFVLAPLAMVPLVLMPIVGTRIPHMNIKITVAAATVLLAVALWLHGRMYNQVDFNHLVYIRLMMGLGMPFLFIPLITVAYIDVPPAQLASATGILNFFRMVSASMATALAATAWQDRSVFHRSQMVERVTPDMLIGSEVDSLIESLGISDLSGWQAIEYRIAQEASTLGLNDVMTACALVMSLALPLALLLPSYISHSKSQQTPEAPNG